jgi:hypothetical protein
VTKGIIYATTHHMTRAAPQLKKGDRVQLIRPIAGVAVGTRGIILRRFTFDSLYDVWFDGYAAPRLVNTRELAPAEALTA